MINKYTVILKRIKDIGTIQCWNSYELMKYTGVSLNKISYINVDKHITSERLKDIADSLKIPYEYFTASNYTASKILQEWAEENPELYMGVY